MNAKAMVSAECEAPVLASSPRRVQQIRQIQNQMDLSQRSLNGTHFGGRIKCMQMYGKYVLFYSALFGLVI